MQITNENTQITPISQPPAKFRSSKRFIFFVVAFLLILGLALSAGALFLSKSRSLPEINNGWKTYQGDSFTIDYPQNMDVKSQNSSMEEHIAFLKNQSTKPEDVIRISIYTNWSPEQAISYNVTAGGQGNTVSTDIVVDGIKGKKVIVNDPRLSKVLYVFSNNKTYTIDAYFLANDTTDTVEKMVKSIKFTTKGQNKLIENYDISAWQTYRSERGGYEVKYPQNWTPREVANANNQANVSLVLFDDKENKNFSINIYPLVDINYYLKQARCEKSTTVKDFTLKSGKTISITDACDYRNTYFWNDITYNVLVVVQTGFVLANDPLTDAFISSFNFVSPGPNPTVLNSAQATVKNLQQQAQQATLSPANIQRQADVNAISNAIKKYTQDHGTIPPGLASDMILISKDSADICKDLVPQYLSALPVDPSNIDHTPISNCNSNYITNYFVKKISSGIFSVYAPAAGINVDISSH